MICYLFPEPTYLFFSSDVPALLYYAHIPAIVISLILGFYVFWQGRQFLLNRLFFIISFFFALWTTLTLVQWTNIHSDFILFTWSFAGLILGIIAISCVYFIYVFLEKKDVSLKIKVIFFSLLSPIFFLSSSSFNLNGFDITNCDAFKFEWLPFKIYYTSLGVLAIIWVFVLLIRKYRATVDDFKKQIVLMGAGVELFLFVFFGMIFLASYFTQIGILSDSSIEMYGLLGMVIFMIYIGILMVRFKTFNTKLFATQALVWGLVALVGSQFFFIKVTTNFILNGITFVGAIIFGQILVRSVRKEVKQKEELAKLNIDLQKLIQQRESLVHLITHKVKGSFTHTKYIFAEMLEGSFGVISPELKKMALFGLASDNTGVETVDLILNASNLQKGIVKFDLKQISFKEILLGIIEEKKEAIQKKGLELEINIGEEDFSMNGDAFWLKEVINNMINNAFNYTKVGRITIGLEKKDKKFVFYVKDTGVGITDEDKRNLFKEGARGKESVKINVDSTGYGLYTVKLIVEAHNGKVWVESEGKDRGSQFFVELYAL